MTTANTTPLRPFAIMGYSIAGEVVCPECLRTAFPMTGERVSHTCRSNRVRITDHIRQLILELDKAHTRPTAIAKSLKLTLPTVMKVLSGEADDDTNCPACDASGRPDAGSVLFPIYAGDSTMAEETCTHCEKPLLALAHERARTLEKDLAPQHLVTPQGFPALRFERRPPAQVLQALKSAGWRWDPRDRCWFDPTRAAALPPGVNLPEPVRVVAPRSPIIRRRRADPAAATVH
jgi:hypothetical protein